MFQFRSMAFAAVEHQVRSSDEFTLGLLRSSTAEKRFASSSSPLTFLLRVTSLCFLNGLLHILGILPSSRTVQARHQHK